MTDTLQRHLQAFNLTWMINNLDDEIADSLRRNRPVHEIIERLIGGELSARDSRSVQRHLATAKIPRETTLGDFDFHHPTSINADQVRHLFTLDFMNKAANVIFVGGVGLGKTHLAQALAVKACERKIDVLFVSAVAMLNHLMEAGQDGQIAEALRRYTRPKLLIIDELGYLPIEAKGINYLFQVISGRYEKASTVITTNRIYKEWHLTFNNDAVQTSAILDRLLHHSETVIIQGPSYRMKDRQTDSPPASI